jgi:hypothetical protein
MLKAITVQEAKEALKYLKTLTPANPKMDDDLEMSIKESIAFMAPDLLRLSKRGFTHKELADGLNACGIAVKSGTLNRYINEHLSASRSSAESDSVAKTEADTPEKPEGEIRNGAAKNPKLDGQTPSGKSDSATALPANPAPSKQEQPHV